MSLCEISCFVPISCDDRRRKDTVCCPAAQTSIDPMQGPIDLEDMDEMEIDMEDY